MKCNAHIFSLIVALTMTALTASAQVDAQLTQYWAAPAYYNAGAIGVADFIHITGGARMQWVGIKNAPTTFLAMADMPFKFLNKRWGVGVVLQQESIGLYRNLTAMAQFAWKKKLFKGMLSVGVQAGLYNQTFKGSEIFIPEGDDAHTATDDAIPQTDITGNAFDLCAGIYYTHKWFWVGVSGTHLLQPKVTLKSENTEEAEYEFEAGRSIYFMAGSNIPIKNTLFEIQPSVFFKTDLQFYQVEATARVRYNKFLSGGVGYRWKDAVMLMIGAEFKNFFIGYSYDYHTSAINKGSSGSHEVMVGYNVKLDMNEKNKNKQKSIRLM